MINYKQPSVLGQTGFSYIVSEPNLGTSFTVLTQQINGTNSGIVMQTCEDQGVVSEIVFCEQKFYNIPLFQNTVSAYSVIFLNGELNYAVVFSSNKNTFYIYGQYFNLIN
jgi:hypothetical protein